jgi:PKD repeat protein
MKNIYILMIVILSVGLLSGVAQALEYNPSFVPVMTSNTAPSPNTSTARSEYPGYEAWHAFDGDKVGSGFWNSLGSPYQWVQIYTPTGHIAANYTVWPLMSSENYRPETWTFEGSNDNSTFTVLDTRSGITNWGTSNPQSFEFTNANSYTYYRMNVTTSSGTATYVCIQELQIYELSISGPPGAHFSSFNTAGPAPFTTYLYDTSTNVTPVISTFFWDFGDGNTSSSQNTFHTWNITGTYTVKHSVYNGMSTNWSNQTDYITVGTPTPPVVAPIASFYGGPQLGAVPLTVFFTDVSTNTPTGWNWSMGDGTFNESQNPVHIYNGSGFFTVNLTATNSAGSNTTSQTNFVMVY